MSRAAKRLAEHISSTAAQTPQASEADTSIIRAMQRRGIVGEVAGVLQPADEAAAEAEAAYRDRLAAVKAALTPQADEPDEETPPPLTAAQLLAQAIYGAGSAVSPQLPLNGAALLQRALAAGNGTINGQA